jgi:hypothetical protein
MKSSALCILLILLSCWLAKAQDTDSVLSYNRLMAYDTVYFSRIDPIAFLDSLKVYPVPSFTVWRSHRGWVKEIHIPRLIELLDDHDTCANVMSALSSYLELRRSTVAQEAAFIIYGFRTGVYPPTLNSSSFRWTKDEIIRWWHSYSIRQVKDQTE